MKMTKRVLILLGVALTIAACVTLCGPGLSAVRGQDVEWTYGRINAADVSFHSFRGGPIEDEISFSTEFRTENPTGEWWEIQLSTGEVGWIQPERAGEAVVLLAEEGDEHLRRYEDGTCYATPTSAQRAEDAGALDRWQHQLRFSELELSEEVHAILMFDGDTLGSHRNYRIAEWDPVVIELSAGWVFRHPAVPELGLPGWQHPGAWQLVFECEAE